MPTTPIPLGARVRDTITGVTGIAVARTTWLNGCRRVTIQPEELKDGKPVEFSTVDEEQIAIVEANTPHTEKVPRGGPMPEVKRSSDPR